MSDEFDEVSRRLHGTTNGMVWAEEYARLFPDGTGDVGTMVGWFANAIEVGRAAGQAERNRLRAVVEAAEQFVHDRARWHLELERDDAGPGEQFRLAYDNALGVLVDVVFALDVSPTGEGT